MADSGQNSSNHGQEQDQNVNINLEIEHDAPEDFLAAPIADSEHPYEFILQQENLNDFEEVPRGSGLPLNAAAVETAESEAASTSPVQCHQVQSGSSDGRYVSGQPIVPGTSTQAGNPAGTLSQGQFQNQQVNLNRETESSAYAERLRTLRQEILDESRGLSLEQLREVKERVRRSVARGLPQWDDPNFQNTAAPSSSEVPPATLDGRHGHGIEQPAIPDTPTQSRDAYGTSRQNSPSKPGKSPTMKKCQECGKSVLHLHHHMNRMHPSLVEKKWKCQLCGSPFRTQTGLNIHQQAMHPRGEVFCISCGNGFRSLEELNQHKASEHPEPDGMDESGSPPDAEPEEEGQQPQQQTD